MTALCKLYANLINIPRTVTLDYEVLHVNALVWGHGIDKSYLLKILLHY